MLFDLATDIAEQNDLSQREGERLRAMQAAYAEWNASNIDPLWVRQTGPGGAAGRRRER
jgi:hypothetical protein